MTDLLAELNRDLWHPFVAPYAVDYDTDEGADRAVFDAAAAVDDLSAFTV